ncbi:gag-pol polyprotein [Cucumis melo var. makuwa]|uniref:Gag-pol polyprotein n=1 Tax=Cucumis melo var. makuwa TaxID=1194695 RepID=A0A5D3DME6_CUCMM|nr:gag-pol polyprotein [Cucumis melo var. makuwa]TYK24764.1 gag-pol polyprotein [Cucumis melo var. makuwa]
MKIIMEGPLASRHPILDGKNYSYWKPPIISFIKTVDEVSIPKSKVHWTDAKEQAFVGNARALNAILNGVDLNVFKLINSCSSAKEA